MIHLLSCTQIVQGNSFLEKSKLNIKSFSILIFKYMCSAIFLNKSLMSESSFLVKNWTKVVAASKKP